MILIISTSVCTGDKAVISNKPCLVYNLRSDGRMSFSDIVGHARIQRILGKALERGRLPNSLLFAGPPGVGKIDTALVTAKALNCLTLEADACETCAACKAISKGNYPDVMRLEPEKEILKIDQMRILKEAAYLRPMVGRRRVFIVNRAEAMSSEAANSLLKVLEEPPAFSHIFLITSNPFIILPTIRSRCQTLSFSPVSREDIERCLLEHDVEQHRAKILSLLVRGNLKQAMNMDWEEVDAQREEAWQLFRSFLTGTPDIPFFKEYSGRTRGSFADEFRPQLELLASFARDLLLVKEGGDTSLLLNPDFESRLREESPSFQRERILEFLDRIEGAFRSLQRNMNIKLFMSGLIADTMEHHHV
jgi:DNA polymerase-3 subunit delta'